MCASSSSSSGSHAPAGLPASTPNHQNGSIVLNASSRQDGSAAGSGQDGPSSTAGNSAKTSPRSVEWLLQNLHAKGYQQPTPIQRQAIPTLMASRELLAVAPTGSGKTVAFCAPILLHLKALRARARKAAQQAEEAAQQAQQAQQQGSVSKAGTPAKGQPPSSKKAKRGGAEAALAAAAEAAAAAKEMWPDAIKAVILSPSHELTAQQGRVLKQLLPGSNLKASILTRSTAAGTNFSKVDILLANPLRLATLADEGKIDLSHVRFLVLDEADKLFEMGFVEQIDAVLSACKHKSIVRALFSATLPEKVEDLARTVLVEPLRVTVGARNTAVNTVDQRLLFVGRENGKLLALRQLLTEGLKPPVLVFVATKDRARALHKELMYDGVRADSLSASQSMAARTAAVDNFRSGRTWVLVSTDLIGRGMDFIGVNTVINYDMPATTTDYIHRIGRTGRAGHTGTAVTFFTEEDKPVLRPVANLIRESGGNVPDWMTKMKKVRTKDRKKMKLSEKEASGATISTQTKEDKQKAKKRAMIAASKAKKAKLADKQA
uniref:RNA helicase n=1 Tax=Dunaliella tertiolecta TaxID=3047 RepID=A0A6S8LCF8_DUNTE